MGNPPRNSVESRSDHELEAGSDSRAADRRGFVGPTEFAAALGWQLATALFAPTLSSEVSSIGNAHRRPGRAKTRYHRKGTGGRARQSGGTSGPPKLDSTDSSVQCTLLQRTVATVLHDGSELEFRAVSFPGPTELRLLSLTGQQTCPALVTIANPRFSTIAYMQGIRCV